MATKMAPTPKLTTMPYGLPTPENFLRRNCLTETLFAEKTNAPLDREAATELK